MIIYYLNLKMTAIELFCYGFLFIFCTEISAQLNDSTNTTESTNITDSISANMTVVNASSVTNLLEIGVNSTDATINESSTVISTNNTNSTEINDILKTLLIQVSLHYSYDNEFICGGTIISTNLLLTAASCMYYSFGGVLPPIILQVQVGRNNLNELALQQHDVENITFHQDFSSTTMQYNLALIEIKSSFIVNSNVSRTILNKTFPTNTNNCILTGWENATSTLQAITVKVVACPTTSWSNIICAQPKLSNETICNHFLGSSLVCDGQLVGILSEDPDCSSTYAVFENLTNSNSVRWLQNTNAFSDESSNNTATAVTKVSLLLIMVITYLGLSASIM